MAEDMRALLERLKDGAASVDDVMLRLRMQPFEELGFAKVDHHRSLRQGVCEVIYCAGKTPEQTRAITRAMLERGADNILLTRAAPEVYEAVRDLHPDIEWHGDARIVVVARRAFNDGLGTIAIVSGGTSDQPVAEEAAITAETLGNTVDRIYDVGVAGLHRLLSRMDRLMSANALVVVAGMEGALPSVVAGLVDRPVIAVPTSVGYGANFGGLSALLTMLNSCASGVTVVNIDNGFGAGFTASLINKKGRAQA